ncbi:MAG: hypothetical protein SNJ70_06685 [Armatimonadota bacterium]
MFSDIKIIKKTPISIRRETNFVSLLSYNPCDNTIFLGSFWPGLSSGFESQIVKTFKNCYPANQFQSHINMLIDFYIDVILKELENIKIDSIVRVLSSSETDVDPQKPASILIDSLSKKIKAQNLSFIFYRSQPRPSLRTVKRMQGPDAFKQRLYYAGEDLFLKPINIKGRVLLVDDIYNTGASVRIYANALKMWCGADEVISLNLAATRFNNGKDGLGFLKLDTAGLNKYPMLKTCVVSDNLIHKNEDCNLITKRGVCMFEFYAEKNYEKCKNCYRK